MKRLTWLPAVVAVAAAALAQPAAAEARRVIIHQEADYYGFDYQTLMDVALDACQSACLKDTQCRAFTYNKKARRCFLKSEHGELKSFAGAVTGQVVDSQPQPDPALEAATTPGFVPNWIAEEARRYRREVVAADGDETQTVTALLASAGQALSSGDPRTAADLYRAAIARSPDGIDAWLGLTQAYLAFDLDQGSDRYVIPMQATSAALNGFLVTRTAPVRAEALALLAKALELRELYRAALESYKASLALNDSPAVRQAFADLRARRGFRVVDNTVDSDSLNPRICIQFSEALVKARTDYATFITVNEQAPASVEVEQRQLCVGGVVHGERYRIALRTGLPSAVGEVLEQPAALNIYVRDRAPSVRFAGDSFVLPRVGAKGLPVVTINTGEVDLSLYRIGERGLARLLTDSTFLRQLDGYEVERITDDLGERLWTGTLEVTTQLNREVVTSFPLDQALPERRPGVYVLIGTAKGDRSETWTPKATQWFVVSDIGLTAMTGGDGLNVFARSLASAAGLAGVELQLVARSNEVLATAVTDASGRARFDAGRVRGTGALAPALLIAKGDSGDFVLLDLTRPGFDLTDRGVAGRPAPQALDLFLYTERGIYRAGETVHVAGLLRDDVAKAVPGIPLTMVFERPDGVEHRRLVSDDQGLGGHWLALDLPGNAMRGTWRVKAYTDPKASPLAEQRFLVEDFVPDRIEFELAGEPQRLALGEPAPFTVEGRFLYGAKASGLVLEGELAVARGRSLAGYAGFVFGLQDETAPPIRRPLDDLPLTDEVGRAEFDVVVGEAPEGAGPIEATVTVRMREGGGRAVERSATLPVAADEPLIGIRPLFGGEVGQGETASFEVIAVGPDGQRVSMPGVVWSLVRIERNYQWYRSDGTWNYEPVTHTRKVADGRLDLAADAAGRVAVPVDWGRYRLDVESSDATGPASSVEFTAGWYVEASSTETPDGLEMALDKDTYRVGETARLSISPRFAGTAQVAVGAERLLTAFTAEVPEAGAVIDLPVADDWGAGAYVTVTLFRPGEGPETRLPQRAIGVKWLKVDPAERQLRVALDLPEKVEPRSSLTIPVTITGLKAGERGRVMVAAVDVGILNLTRYEPPAPDDWFFGQRQMGIEIRDLYGRLIDGSLGAPGRIRSGGDEGGPGMQGSPPTEPLVALFSGVVETDESGRAEVSFAIPQFNGTARVMAVAWSEDGIGHAAGDVIIRDPVVVTASLPRFLAPKDEAVLRLDVAATDAPAGDYQLTVEASEGIAAAIPVAGLTVSLEAGRRTAVAVPLTGRLVGTGSLTVRLASATGPSVEKVVSLPVRLPDHPVSERRVLALRGQGGGITLDADLLRGFRADGAILTVGVSRSAGFDVPSLILALDRFPYGCAEQTTSKALPLLYMSELSAASGMADDPAVRGRIQEAIDRVLLFQSSSGSFGLWSPGFGDLWLDAYVSDFLVRARELGYAVPDLALTQALDNLGNSLAYESDVKARGSEIAYALYVLARGRRASIGDLRYYADTRLDEFATAMAKAQLAAALALYGEAERAETAFAAALAALDGPGSRTLNRSDYGSRLRDGAATLALAAETRPAPRLIPDLIRLVAQSRLEQGQTSTQENAWLLLAARALRAAGDDLRLEINGTPHSGAYSVRLDADTLAVEPVVILNRSDMAVDALVTVTGVPETPPPAGGEGFAIERSYYTVDGDPVDVATVGQNERLVVVIEVREDNAWPSRVLVSDLLPAGFEIDNPRLVGSADLGAFEWLPDSIEVAHTEFRDDRFVAALDRTADNDRSFTLAYVVRAVSPGRYVHPAAVVEDMYRPHLQARTGTGTVEITGPQP